jgi:cytochrome b subunit of formate dehydrogenase
MGGAPQTRRLWKAGHVAHAGSFLVLLATGALLFAPTFRAHLIGGYSLHVRLVHCWAGVVFVVATLPFVRAVLSTTRAAAPASDAARHALRPWHRAHLLFTVGSAAAFTVTGFLLWQQQWFGLAVADSSASIHRWLTYLAAAVLAAHLSVAVLAPALSAVSVRYHRDRERLPRAVKGAASCG